MIHERLGPTWDKIFTDLGLPNEATPTLARVLDRYREPQRHYHGVDHVSHVLMNAESIIPTGVLGPVLTTGIFLHDVVYDIPSDTKISNEKKSAIFAIEMFTAHLVPEWVPQAFLTEVVHLIRSTEINISQLVSEPETYNEAIMRDADLAGLASTWAVYSANSRKIRKEFGQFSDEKWEMGRAQFLRLMLATKNLYWTPWMQEQDQYARENMERELLSL